MNAKQPDLEHYLQSHQRYRDALNLPYDAPITLSFVAEGEYNCNFSFENPVTHAMYLLRVNKGSQMHLNDQITYEANALKLLENSGRTPHVYYVDDSKQDLPYGISIMDFLPGRPLDYAHDLHEAASILADIHSVTAQKNSGLIAPVHPLQDILNECQHMFARYVKSPSSDQTVISTLNRFFTVAASIATHENAYSYPYRCIVNTELNSHNFLILDGQPGYLIDWEKPIISVPEQDLAHFLAPTTTFWKTDTILTADTCEAWIDDYITAVQRRFSTDKIRLNLTAFITVTCLRGITWCAMAYADHIDNIRHVADDFTFNKVRTYIHQDFLNYIWNRYYAIDKLY